MNTAALSSSRPLPLSPRPSTRAKQSLQQGQRRRRSPRQAPTPHLSLQAEQPLEGEDLLTLLVEKDFKCVVPRPGEAEYDGFPHPTGEC